MGVVIWEWGVGRSRGNPFGLKVECSFHLAFWLEDIFLRLL
jgi:hypothetical protein